MYSTQYFKVLEVKVEVLRKILVSKVCESKCGKASGG